MNAQLLPILMGIAAIVVTALKFRSLLRAQGAEESAHVGSLRVEGGLITVSGVTVPQLQAIAKALSNQEPPREGVNERRSN